jgi:hypothetical protein
MQVLAILGSLSPLPHLGQRNHYSSHNWLLSGMALGYDRMPRRLRLQNL